MLPKITSRQNPIVARYRDSARGRPSDSLLLDGAHLVSEALAAGVPLRHVAVSSDALERDDIRAIVDTLAGRGIDIAAASAAVMQAISPVRSASPIVAIGERPAAGSHIYRDHAGRRHRRGREDREWAPSCASQKLAARGLVAAGRTANPFGWKALRGSMGSALRLPVAVDPATDHAAADARRHGWLVAMVPRAANRTASPICAAASRFSSAAKARASPGAWWTQRTCGSRSRWRGRLNRSTPQWRQRC